MVGIKGAQILSDGYLALKSKADQNGMLAGLVMSLDDFRATKKCNLFFRAMFGVGTERMANLRRAVSAELPNWVHGNAGRAPINKTGAAIVRAIKRRIEANTRTNPSDSSLIATHGGNRESLVRLVKGDAELHQITVERLMRDYLKEKNLISFVVSSLDHNCCPICAITTSMLNDSNRARVMKQHELEDAQAAVMALCAADVDAPTSIEMCQAALDAAQKAQDSDAAAKHSN